MEDDVSTALCTTANKSSLGSSGIGYKILKWAHTACPNYLPYLFNLCLASGTHPWRLVTIVMVNKPQKPDYSIPKVYCPIALMECTSKLLEKIITKCFNNNILCYNLLPMTQFGSHPHHNTIDTVACLIHKIQGTLSTRHAIALLLFDISRFFNNVNPDHTVVILHNLSFPTNVCD
jgi:hypothetical protein